MHDNIYESGNKNLAMELERNIRSLVKKAHSSNPSTNKSTPTLNPNQGIASLLVMLAVLTIIVLFCCFSAPGIRSLCKKYVFRSCPYDDTDIDNASTIPESSTPTVILLPYGRMLVVDRNVFSQLHADQSGIDLMELGANLIRTQHPLRQITGSTPSILDSDNTSKGMSPTSLGYGPPAYEDIFGIRPLDLPPSYSEVSLMLKNQRNVPRVEHIEMGEIRRNWASDGGIAVEEGNAERTIRRGESDGVCIDVNSANRVEDNEDSV